MTDTSLISGKKTYMSVLGK